MLHVHLISFSLPAVSPAIAAAFVKRLPVNEKIKETLDQLTLRMYQMNDRATNAEKRKSVTGIRVLQRQPDGKSGRKFQILGSQWASAVARASSVVKAKRKTHVRTRSSPRAITKWVHKPVIFEESDEHVSSPDVELPIRVEEGE